MTQQYERHNRYGRDHHDKCMCDGCAAAYERHNLALLCKCFDCTTTRTVNSKDTIPVATVNFCERCNTMCKSTAVGSLSYNTDRSKPLEAMELCPGCVGELLDWLKIPESIDLKRPKHYAKPYDEMIAETADPFANVTTQELAIMLTARMGGEAAKGLAKGSDDNTD